MSACFTGVVQQWLNASISDELFRLRAIRGSLPIAALYVPAAGRPRLDELVAATQVDLAIEYACPPSPAV